MARIALVDFGVKRIGIALSDERKILALPFATVDGRKNGVQATILALASKKMEIEKIVVGLPLLLSGEKGEMALAAEKFAKALEQAAKIPVELYDERLSSKGAERYLQEASLNRKQRAAHVDESAAALLLQSYLDKNNL